MLHAPGGGLVPAPPCSPSLEASLSQTAVRKIRELPATCLLVALALAACGGGGGDPPSSNTSTKAVSGVVVDGPIEGATVFLDLNDNQLHDADEPISAPSDPTGAYRLELGSVTPEQLASGHLITIIPDTAKDSDDGGKTLAEAGRRGFTLMTPGSAVEPPSPDLADESKRAILSPLTTLVAAEMRKNGSSLSEAKDAVRQQIGLDADDVMSNFVAQRNDRLGRIARTAAIALGEAHHTVEQTDVTSPLPEGERLYAAIESALGVIQTLNRDDNAIALSVDDIKDELEKPERRVAIEAAIAARRATIEQRLAAGGDRSGQSRPNRGGRDAQEVVCLALGCPTPN